MQKIKTAIFIITGFICVGVFLFVFLPDHNQSGLKSVEAIASVNQEKLINTVDALENVTIKDVPKEAVEKNENSITNEIKAKVREVVEGALDLFIKEHKIVAIGDSLTEGVGDESKNGGYVGILNNTFEDNNLNITVDNFGKKGNRSDQLLKRLEKKDIVAAIEKADIVLVTIGANDIMKVLKSNFMNVTMDLFEEEKVEYSKRLTAIMDKINEINPETQVYLIGFYNPFERHFGEIKELSMIIDNWNDTGKSLTEEYENVRYIPTIDLFSHSTIDLLADDEFHPNIIGYKRMAQRVLEYIKDSKEETKMTNAVIDS
ncbi:SGNH/GDSL hydrolase family protein [Neobacillus niacini]|uniref:SGNH/GDSL hydrolase family protein n=1 Tax=Neobacillus niacini TaxID=86668 RepID=UPI002FFFF26E